MCTLQPGHSSAAGVQKFTGWNKGDDSTLAMKTTVSTKAVPAPSIPKGDRNMESCTILTHVATPKHTHTHTPGQAMPCLKLVSVSDQDETAQLNHVATKGADRGTAGEGSSDLFLD